ncbi:gustatory receptor for sugar taste 64f-like [Frankliniella occidentalis]|uniref:Gustatory receptor for sugar taste 64f-like n=1 Tax=Frankliniella occidentalis TaxID=133901 RepID=A0A9C6WRL5_FRAOC|nr:gustatory receptor for sugar taste 64f-like [Frankliniella occidentalis]
MSVLLVLSHEEDLSTSVKFVNGIKGNIVHTSSVLAVLFLFLRLSRRWHRVCAGFQRVERRLATEGFNAVSFGSYIRSMTAVFILATFVVEMAVDAVPSIAKMMENPRPFDGVGDFVEKFYYESFPQMKIIPVYNIALVIWVFWTKAQAKLAITYTDLILWAIGAAAAAKFKSINKKIGELKYEKMTEMDWRRVRESYNDVVVLISDLDRILGPHVLLSYAIGLWFVCGGILLLLDSEIDTLKRVYIFLSMSFWICRVIVATLSLASVYEENICIRNSLHLVPTDYYGDEVHRFAMQACHDDLGFTGMKFFTVTRSVLLTLAGTIASYEIVLMEFNR